MSQNYLYNNRAFFFKLIGLFLLISLFFLIVQFIFGRKDSDGDGIRDHIECPGNKNCRDNDGDGRPNYLDTDDDDDGIPTLQERENLQKVGLSLDTDNDGILDYLDTDDDGDGILTYTENSKQNKQGLSLDTDNDGILDYLDIHTFFSDILDSDKDGLSDGEECGKTALCPDSDDDGIPNHQDTDSDNDGGHDSDEGNITTDSDQDGVPDVYDPYPSFNTAINGPDNDPDNDGLTNSEEDHNQNGDRTDDDSDGDFLPDYLDTNHLIPTPHVSNNTNTSLQNSGTVTGEYHAPTTTNAPQSIGPHRCVHPFGGHPLSHQQSIRAYQKNQVSYPETCISEERNCQYGSLGGTYTFSTCTQIGNACTTPTGEKTAHEHVATYYKDSEVIGVPLDGEDLCIRQARRCIDGKRYTLDGQQNDFTYKYRICQVKAP